MILILFLCIFFRLICQTYDPGAQNLLCGRFDLKLILQDLATKVGVIILVCSEILNLQMFNKFKICFISTMVIFAFYKLYIELTYYRYISTIVTNINHIILSIQITILLITLVTFFTSLPLITQNALYLYGSLSLFILKTIDSYFRQNQHNIKLKIFQQLRTEEQAVIYFISLNRMIEEVGDSNEVTQKSFYLRNIANVHRNSCMNIQCYCKTNLYKQRKFHRLYNLFAEELENKLSQKYDRCFQLNILIMYQKLTIHKNYLHHGVQSDFSYLKLSWIQKVIIQKYSHNVQIFLSQKQSQYQIAKTQKYSQFQKIENKLNIKIFQMSKLKLKFWNNFTKCNINKEQFQSICNNQLKIMRECSQLKQIIWSQYRFHTLINSLIAYEKCILLSFTPTDQLCNFLQQQKQMINSPIYKLERYDMFMMQKYLQSSLMCCFETSLAFNKIGTIVNAFNTDQTFGYSQSTLINTNISMLMPASMQKQHQLLMENWTKNCNWHNIGHFRQIFCIDSKGQSFSCKIYLKPVHRLGLKSGLDDGVNILGTLIKVNTKDYLIVDEKQYIVGAGQIFTNLFGPNIIGIPLNIICADASRINSESSYQKKIKIKTTFYSTKNIQQFFKYYHNKNIQNIDFNQEQLLQKFSQILIAQPYYFNIEVQLSIYYMGSIKLILLKVISVIKRQNLRNIISVQNAKLIPTSPAFPNTSNSSHKSHSSNQSFISAYEIQCKHEYSGIKSFSKSMPSNKILAQSSIASVSSTTSSFRINMHIFQSIFYKGCKIFEKTVDTQDQGQTQKKTTIYDIRILRKVGIILVLIISCIVLNGIKMYMNYSGYQEMQDIFYGDGACSDNMGLSMLVYNRALNIYEIVHKIQKSLNQSFLGNSSTQETILYEQLNSEIRHNNLQFQLVHSKIFDDVQFINRQLTALTKTRIYAYGYLNTTWTKISGQNIPIMTVNFIQNFLYSVHKVSFLSIQIIDQIKLSGQTQKHTELFSQMQTQVTILKNNFPTLYSLNNQYLLFYTNLFLSNSQTISLTSYLKFSIIFVFTASFLVIIFSNIKYRTKQLQGIYTMFRKMQTNIVQILLAYFRKVNQNLYDSQNKQMQLDITQNENFKQQISLAQKAKVMNKLHEETLSSLHHFTNSQNSQPNLKFYQTSNLNSLFPKLIIFLILIIICIVNLLMVFAEYNIIKTTKIMMDDMNGLIQSHNTLIGSYLQAKGLYTLRAENTKIDSNNLTKVIQKILLDVNVTQSAFNQIAISTLGLFKNYDQNFEEDLMNIIVDNVCDQIKGNVQVWSYNQCVQDQKMEIIKLGGAINGLNYFTRILQQNYIGYLTISSSSQQFQAEFVFPILDKIIFPIFIINQEIQNQITKSLMIAINNQNIQYLLLMACEIIIFCGAIIYMRKFYIKQNKESIGRMGRILLMPLRAMRNVSGIMKLFQKISDFKNLRYKNLQ